MRQLLVLGAVIAAQVWWLPQSWGDEGQPRRSKDVAGPAGLGVVVGDLDNDGRLDLLGPAVPAKRRLVTLDDGTKLPLDPAGLLVTQTLKGRFIVDWNSPLTVAESGGPIPIKLRNVPLTLNLRDIGGGKQGVVRLRAPAGEAAVELRLRPATGKTPVRLEITPVRADQEGEAKAGDKPLRLRLRSDAAEIEVVPVEGTVAVRVVGGANR